MPNRYHIRARLRVGGPHFDPDSFSAAIGLDPSRQFSPGQPRPKPTSRPNPTSPGLWSLESPLPETAPLADHLNWLLDRLSPCAAALHAYLAAAPDVSANFYIGYSLLDHQGGPTLTPDLLTRLAEFGIEVQFECHS